MVETSPNGDRRSDMNLSLALAFPISSSLEISLRGDCNRLIEFEAELIRAIEESNELANVQGSPSDWNIGCQHHWDHVQAILRRIHRLEAKISNSVDNGHSQGAWKMWEELLRQEARLAFALSGLHSQALQLNETAAREWNTIVLMVESHRKIVQTDIQRLHFRLKSWTAQGVLFDVAESRAEAEPEQSKTRPGGEGMDPDTYDWEFDQAAIEIEAEQHEKMGVADVVKSLFMWVESPEERVLKNHNGVLPQT